VLELVPYHPTFSYDFVKISLSPHLLVIVCFSTQACNVVLFVVLANKFSVRKVTLPKSALHAYMPKNKHCGHDKVLHQSPSYESHFGLVINDPITCTERRCLPDPLPCYRKYMIFALFSGSRHVFW
jgi:hypothetical protein